ncbi:MAG TPA: SH3 domain-containing protein [Anaerolineales bacterium]|nr:SH3 domain-containing protein [Anaerolineales bacterium]HLO28169.1 SH3 domain-containing protein [Anaerolineales bacterium]
MKRASAPRYDRFKTVVAVILAIILLLMLLRGCATNPVPFAPSENLPVASATNLLPTSAPPTQTVPAANFTETSSPTLVPPTVEVTATPGLVAAPATATPASAATEGPTAVPAQAASTPQASNVSCNTVAPSRLSVGQKARVTQRLNVRSSASIKASIVKVNPTNSQVEIIGGPTCEPAGGHAYLWWQIRLADGTEGWSAESPLNNASYFLEPIQ